MVRLEWAAIYVGVNILLLLALAVLTMLGRRKHKVALGDGANEDMLRRIRAHANAAEYIPAALVGIVLVALLEPGAPEWLLHASGLTLTAGRILHGIGLHTGVLNAGRMFGMVLTWTCYGLLGVGLIYAGLAQAL